MRLQGTESLPGTPEALWHILFDPDVIATTIPGCRDLRRLDASRYTGVVEVKLGPFASAFDAVFTVSDQEYPHRYRMRMDADGRSATVTADIRVALEPDGPDRSRMTYDADAAIGGGLAGFAFLAEPLAQMLITQGLADLKRKVEEKMGAAGG